MRSIVLVIATVAVTAAAGGCAGKAYLPGDPGGAKSDVSGRDVRDAWLAANPEADPDIRAAIEAGVFVPGMTTEERDVVTNPDRRGATGNGYWRSRETGDEIRYQWYVSGEREPFDDGRGDRVCELVFVEGLLRQVRYCGSTDGS